MFRKIISYLAYSPAMLWKLSELDRKNKKDLRDTNWSILLLSILIAMTTVLWLGRPNINEHTIEKESTDYQISDIIKTIDLERHTHQIKPSQAISFVLSATNDTKKAFTGKLFVDLSKTTNYLTPISIAENSVSVEKDSIAWFIDELMPGESIQTTLKFQSLNSFGATLSDRNDRCLVEMRFGNKISIPAECPKLKLAQIKLIDGRIEDTCYTIIIIIATAVLVMKLTLRTELKLAIKETRLIRREINSGEVAL